MKNEIWKDIPNYEGLYQSSNLGRVKSLKRKGLIKAQRLSKGGYLIINLCKNGIKKTFYVHKLIYLTFKNVNSNHKNVIDHIDNNPLNNNLDNLQLITQRENTSKDKKGYTSKYIGVYWVSGRKKWKSQIRINNGIEFLGYFNDEYEASLAYQNKLKKITNV